METNSEQWNKEFGSALLAAFEEKRKQEKLYNVKALVFHLERILTDMLDVHAQCPHCKRMTFEAAPEAQANTDAPGELQ